MNLHQVLLLSTVKQKEGWLPCWHHPTPLRNVSVWGSLHTALPGRLIPSKAGGNQTHLTCFLRRTLTVTVLILKSKEGAGDVTLSKIPLHTGIQNHLSPLQFFMWLIKIGNISNCLLHFHWKKSLFWYQPWSWGIKGIKPQGKLVMLVLMACENTDGHF